MFLVYHILHFTTGTAHPDFVELNPHHNVTTGFRNPLVALFYLLAMVGRRACISTTGSGAAAGAWV